MTRQFDIEGIDEADIVAAGPCPLEERGEEMALEGSLRRECYPRLHLGFTEFTSAMQTAEGREDFGVEVGRHENLGVCDPFGYPCRQARID